MKFELNIAKKHLYYLAGLLVFVFIVGIAIAQTAVNNPGHPAEQIDEGTIAGTLTVSGGNVGIGTTTTPIEGKLHVVGDGFFRGPSIGVARALVVDNNDNTNAASHARLEVTTYSANGGDPYILFSNRVINWVAGIDNSDGDKFKISASNALGTSDLVTIQLDGNVGIGTTSPNSGGYTKALTISAGTSGTALSALELQGSRTVSGGFGAIDFRHQSNLVSQFTGYRDGADDAGGFTFLVKPTGGSLAEKMRIDSNGNVGIGTTGPTQKLDVVGTTHTYMRVASDATNEDAGFYSSDGTTNVISGLIGSACGAGQWSVYSGGCRIVVKTDGNVGIGTTNPTYTLEVETAGTTSFGLMSGTGITGLVIKNTINGLTTFDNQNGEIMQMQLDRDVAFTGGNVAINNLAGSGNAYACVNANGQFYRSATACS